MRTSLVISFAILAVTRLSGAESVALPDSIQEGMRYAASLEDLKTNLKVTYEVQHYAGVWTAEKALPPTSVPVKTSRETLLIGQKGRYKHEVWMDGVPFSVATSCLGAHAALAVRSGTLYTGGPRAFHSVLGHPAAPIFIPIGYAVYPEPEGDAAWAAVTPSIYTAAVLANQSRREPSYAPFYVRADRALYADGSAYTVVLQENETPPIVIRLDLRGVIAAGKSSQWRRRVSAGDEVFGDIHYHTKWTKPVSDLDIVVPGSIVANVAILFGEKVEQTLVYTLSAAEVVSDATDEDFTIDAMMAKDVISVNETTE